MSLNLGFDALVAAGGIASGLLTWQLFDLGSSRAEQLLAFAVGAVPGIILTDLSLANTDDDTGSTNYKLVSNSLFNAKQSPGTFAIIVIGMTTVVSLCYQLFLAPEIDSVAAFLPFVRLSGVNIAVTWLGVLAGIMFEGVAGWTIEVFEWLIAGFDPGKVPMKPGGRQVWGLSALPKDLVFFLGAVPIAVVDTLMHAAGSWSLTPVLFLPMKIALDQWSRLGDVVVDAFSSSAVQTIATDAGKAFSFFDGLVHKFFGIFNHSSAKDGVVGGVTPNWYPGLPRAPPNFWLKYPLLFMEGDNDLAD